MMSRLESLNRSLLTAEELKQTLPFDRNIEGSFEKVRDALTKTSGECLSVPSRMRATLAKILSTQMLEKVRGGPLFAEPF